MHVEARAHSFDRLLAHPASPRIARSPSKRLSDMSVRSRCGAFPFAPRPTRRVLPLSHDRSRSFSALASRPPTGFRLIGRSIWAATHRTIEIDPSRACRPVDRTGAHRAGHVGRQSGRVPKFDRLTIYPPLTTWLPHHRQDGRRGGRPAGVGRPRRGGRPPTKRRRPSPPPRQRRRRGRGLGHYGGA